MEHDSQLVHDGVPGVAVGPVQVADVAVVGRPDQSEVSIAAPPIRGEYCGSTNQRRVLRLHQPQLTSRSWSRGWWAGRAAATRPAPARWTAAPGQSEVSTWSRDPAAANHSSPLFCGRGAAVASSPRNICKQRGFSRNLLLKF